MSSSESGPRFPPERTFRHAEQYTNAPLTSDNSGSIQLLGNIPTNIDKFFKSINIRSWFRNEIFYENDVIIAIKEVDQAEETYSIYDKKSGLKNFTATYQNINGEQAISAVTLSDYYIDPTEPDTSTPTERETKIWMGSDGWDCDIFRIKGEEREALHEYMTDAAILNLIKKINSQISLIPGCESFTSISIN